jgi:hypothetical protein
MPPAIVCAPRRRPAVSFARRGTRPLPMAPAQCHSPERILAAHGDAAVRCLPPAVR